MSKSKDLSDIATKKADIDDAIGKAHAQNTDTILDEGGANEVSAEQVRDVVDTSENLPILIKEEFEINNTQKAVMEFQFAQTQSRIVPIETFLNGTFNGNTTADFNFRAIVERTFCRKLGTSGGIDFVETQRITSITDGVTLTYVGVNNTTFRIEITSSTSTNLVYTAYIKLFPNKGTLNYNGLSIVIL